jgi:outer membrane lipoprotein-sorting protein
MVVSAFLAALVLTGPQAPDTIRTGHDLVAAMHARYHDTWYRRLTFVQRVIWGDGRPEGEWWEAMAIPGKLRIDMAPIDAGNGVIYRGDSLYGFSNKTVRASKGANALLILGFDVYGQPPAASVRVLQSERYDLSQLREDTWEGRPAYVVGSAEKQFWIDRDRLLFVRLLTRNANGQVSDVRFNKYERLGGGWIAPEVVFYTDGKETMREIYRDWKADPPLADETFEPRPWHRPAWIPKP